MTVSVAVRSYTHSVTYVADNILKSLKDILLYSGLDPGKLSADWNVLHRGIKTWIESEHLLNVVLEVFTPSNDKLLGRWDIDIAYEWTGGDGQFWTDTEMIRFAIKKAGVLPAAAQYAIKVSLRNGYPSVPGWSSTTFRSTVGMIEQRIGTTVEASGLGGGVSYYRTR
jgi:hypothetical protein